VTGTLPTVWLTEAMLQLAEPPASVVPVQLWTELPDPRVSSTVLPGSGDPKLVSTPESVAGWPLVVAVVPV
jgi:hypothetical protein